MRTAKPVARRLESALVLFVAAAGVFGGIVGCGAESDVPVHGWFARSADGAPVRHLVLEGSDSEMGRAAGRLLRDDVRAAASRPLPESLRPALEGYARAMKPLAPASMLVELEAMAAEAGVSADALFLREAARDGLRWHEAEGAPRTASFASVPGAEPDVVVALAGADADAAGFVVVERHPTGRPATLVIARAGELGALGGISDGGLVVVGAEVALPPERRTLKAPPFAWSVRAALERASTADDAVGRIEALCGHRVLAADRANRRRLGLVTLAREPAREFDANAWVLSSSGAGGEADPLVAALDRRLASYAERPGAAEAVDLALSGRPTDVVGPVLRWTIGGGVRIVPGVASNGIAAGGAGFDYGWAAGAAGEDRSGDGTRVPR